MTDLYDLTNIGPEETLDGCDPFMLQQLISKFKGYPDSGGPIIFLNEDDEPVFVMDTDGSIMGSPGVYVSPDGGPTTPALVLTSETTETFLGMVVEATDLSELTLSWALCDGTLGTVDARNRFVYGAANQGQIGTTGGASTIDVSHSHSHSHTAGTLASASHVHAGPNHQHTGAAHTHPGNHSHGINAPSGTITSNEGGGTPHGYATDTHAHGGTTQSDNNAPSASFSADTGFAGTGNTGSGGGASVTGSTATDATSGGSSSISILPPYIRLAFVQKVA